MIKAYITAAMLLVLAPSAALAQRAGDAALGAVAGAVVLGPVGAVAGAFVGYTAGPSISRSWGSDRSRSSRHREAGLEGQCARREGGSHRPRRRRARRERAFSDLQQSGATPGRSRQTFISAGADAGLSARDALMRRYCPTPLPCASARAERGGRTTVTVQAASAATLPATLPSSERSIEFCRAPMTI